MNFWNSIPRRSVLKFNIIAAAFLVYAMIFLYISIDKDKRISEILDQNIETLKMHYSLTVKNFQIISNLNVDMVHNNKDVLEILTKFQDASISEQADLRKKLYRLLEKQYSGMKKLGVLQFHFLMKNNVTSLRMHKPSKFDDDLTDLKFSYEYVNTTQKNISGLEEGRTSPSFRNVYPLFGLNKEHIGIVDVAFAPETLQRVLLETNGVYSHFIIHKDLLKLQGWNRNSSINTYRVSIENDDYREYVDSDHHVNDDLITLITPVKDLIASKMLEKKPFALNQNIEDTYKIMAYIPIHNIKQKVVAYLVSYTDSIAIKNITEDFYILSFIILIGLILVSSFIYINILKNIELKNEKKNFEHLSQHDSLTQLPNRLLFQDRLNQSIAKALRHKSKFALLYIDIDDFKNVNDTYGHDEGDKLLKVVGSKISEVIREEDTLARFGGDEFIVIADEIDNPLDVLCVANKIINTFKDPIIIENQNHYISTSIGISVFPDDSTASIDLMKYSDIAMYAAKNSGKNNAQFYTSKMTEEVLERVVLENELRLAIKNEEFIVYYQPQINTVNEELIGLEALVRWQHPTRGLIPPVKFISVAEDTGLIISLDKLVMKNAMKQVKEWYDLGLNPGKLSLNLSAKQLQDKDFINTVESIIEDTSFKYGWLELEITESQIMSDPEDAIKILTILSGKGIKLSIDDFGTGYSSLSYLKRLPIDKLKIDRSFIQDLPYDEEDSSITKSIIALAKSLKLSVIAEGVENEEQKDFLVANDCTDIQGYFYSKPITSEELEVILRNGINN